MSHTWKIEVDEISVELKCDGRLVGGDGQFDRGETNPVFKWSLDLDDSEKKKLLGGEEIEKEANVNFKRGDGLNLWPREKAGIVVNSNRYDGRLMITYSQWVNKLINLFDGWKVGGYVNSEFVCDWGKGIRTNSEVIYQGGTVFDFEKRERKLQSKNLSIKIALNPDCTHDQKEKQLECNLK